jgi:hypothetical protein
LTWPLIQLDPTEPGVWLLGSLLAALLVSNAAWLIRRWLATRPRGARFLSWSGLPALTWLPVALYLLAPPLAAWRLGALSPSFLGLAEINWLESLSAGGLLAGLIVGLALFGWLIYRRSNSDLTGLARPVRSIPGWRAPLDAALTAWHWAFYRAAAIGWLAGWTAGRADALLAGVADRPLYWGSWLGLGLIAIEAALNPFARARLRRPGHREPALLRIALAVATTALFVLSRNLWLCLACQVVVETAIRVDLRSLTDATKDG